ncbi:MAG: asparaginase [Burkholderiales bacterium]
MSRAAPATPHVPLTAVTRNGTLESVHAGSVAVVDRDGRVLYAAGDPGVLTFTRSALKPLQALPFVAAGGPARFGYTQPEIAMLCASHAGEPRHVAAAASMLAKAGNDASDLQCGAHAPYMYEARGEVPPPPPYSPLAHNCSGKHSGMLAHCVACGYTKHDYLEYAHPLQAQIRKAVATFAGADPDSLTWGVDGCSAPNYALPLSGLARAFARLASAADDPDYGAAPRTLADAMTAHPAMVSGEHGADLMLMTAGRGDWITKVGAEGVHALGVRSRGWGIAVKVADGNARGRGPAVVAVLDQLGLLDDAAREALAPMARPPMRNVRGTVVGDAHAVLVLDKRPPASAPAANRGIE